MVNGYTAAAVESAMVGASGVLERRWRFELYDKQGNFLRETKSVRVGGGITYAEKQNIRRGGNLQIDEKLFTLTTDYLNPNLDNDELYLPTLYTQIYNEVSLGYWRLGDTSGTTAADASGNSRTGTYTGGVTLNQRSLCEGALTDGAALFDGTNDYVEIADAAAWDVTKMSVEFWVKFTSASAVRIVSRDDVSNLCWNVAINTTLKFRIYIATVVQELDTGVLPNDGIPHHVVFTYNGVEQKGYIDGVLVASRAQTGDIDTGTSKIFISSFRGASAFFAGTIDEVAFYGYALSAAQIRSRSQAGSGQLYEIDFLRDQIKAYCAIKMPTAGTDLTYWAEFPRGFFNFVYPDRNVDATGAYYDCIIQDPTAKLENTTVRSTNYTIAITKKYREALQDLFTYASFTTTQYSITTSTVAETVLPISKEYPIGTTILFIMNELLREMNYRQCSARSDGLILLDPWLSSGSRATEFTFNTDSTSVINTTLKQSANLKDTYNEIFLKRQGSKGVSELVKTVTNNNASHPTSIGRIGYRTYSDINVTAANQTVLDAMAAKLLEEKSRIAYKLEIETPLLCVLDNDDYVRVVGVDPPPLFSAAFLSPPENYLVTGWFEPFDDTGNCKIMAEFYLSVA